jgi:predicted DNA-binding protein (MmcQ/YjbR family)
VKEPLMDEESKNVNFRLKHSVEVTDISVTLNFKFNHDNNPLVVKNPFDKIVVKANWMNESMWIDLRRDGKLVCSQDLFGFFDKSFNQTDIVLTKESPIVRDA